MSHLKERSQKNCLNCNAQIQGRYCHICGQENLEPQESAWHLVTHFINDITHFDGKFFSTLKYLIFKPGFLSREYKLGRRFSYLNPVRMYVFTSAIFFLLFFSITKIEDKVIKRSYNGKTVEEIDKLDSAGLKKFTIELTKGKALTRKELEKYIDSTNKKGGIHFTSTIYNNKAEYDSLLKAGIKKHNWVQRQIINKEIEINEKYKNDGSKIFSVFASNLMHSFPQMLFISLPLFALILNFLYFRRKEFYFSSHAIFGIHLYVFVFIMLLGIIGIRQANHLLELNLLDYLVGLMIILIFYYQYKSMRNFYQQRRGKTILKYILLNLGMLVVITLLFAIFTFFSLLKI